jgi:hypothetical protein
MFASAVPASPIAFAVLIFCFVLVTPPDGNPAIAMLLALFLAALIWNVATWWFGIPSYSSPRHHRLPAGRRADELDHRRTWAGPERRLVAGLVGATCPVRLAAAGILPRRRPVSRAAGGDQRRPAVRADRGPAAALVGAGVAHPDLGKRHLSSAQGALAELVGAALIGTAGFSGLPVSTTHIIASGVAGTMAGSGAGVQKSVIWQIVIAWVATLPATIVLSGALFWLLSAG